MDANFTLDDWQKAPMYEPQGSSSGLIPLDFEVLGAMALQEDARGAFRTDDEDYAEVFSRAPFYLGHLPAAFYQLEAPEPEVMAEHQAGSNETIVVISGVLKIAFPHSGLRLINENGEVTDTSKQGMLYSGQVVNHRNTIVNMGPVGVMDSAKCLALAVFHHTVIELGKAGLPTLTPAPEF